MKTEHAKQLKELEKENHCLKKLLAEAKPDKAILAGGLSRETSDGREAAADWLYHMSGLAFRPNS